MTLNLSVDEVLTTTRSVRKRLDFEKPVPREVLMECLELGAAGADRLQRAGLAMGVRRRRREEEGDRRHLPAQRDAATSSSPKPEYGEGDTRDERMGAVMDSAKYLNEHLHEVPVMLIPCLEGREDSPPMGGVALLGVAAARGVELHAGVALARARLGWTTLHLLGDGEKQAAEVLGIPFDKYSQGGLFPIAYTKGTDFRPAKRLPAEQLTHWNSLVDHQTARR